MIFKHIIRTLYSDAWLQQHGDRGKREYIFPQPPKNPNGHLPWTFARRDKIHWVKIPSGKNPFWINIFVGSNIGKNTFLTTTIGWCKLIPLCPWIYNAKIKFYPEKGLIIFLLKGDNVQWGFCPVGFLPMWQMSMANVHLDFVHGDFDLNPKEGG